MGCTHCENLQARVAALETRVEDDGNRIAELQALFRAHESVIDTLRDALSDLRASIKVTERNHWRREIAARLWAATPYDTRGRTFHEAVCHVDQADMLLAALEAREKEDERVKPCGCVVCVCLGDERCHGCGAKMCDACKRAKKEDEK